MDAAAVVNIFANDGGNANCKRENREDGLDRLAFVCKEAKATRKTTAEISNAIESYLL